MTPRAKALLPLFLLILVGAGYFRIWRSRGQADDALLTLAGQTMGTTYKVLVAAPYGPEPRRLKRVVQAELDRVEGLMSTYQADSEVSKFNALSELKPVPVSIDTARVVAAAQRIARESQGAFDITVRPLVALWGFGAGAKVEPPTPAAVAKAKAKVDYRQIRLKDGELGKSAPQFEVDLSAIAKGYGVDRVVAVLEEQGALNLMAEVGGEVRVRGEKSPGVGWRIGIEEPQGGVRVARRVVELRDGALATSGDYRNYYEEKGERRSHTIDPRTGRPIVHRLASVSVSHSSAMMADGYATAINVLGPNKGYQMAVQLGLAAHLIIRDPDGSFLARSTPRFEQLFPSKQ